MLRADEVAWPDLAELRHARRAGVSARVLAARGEATRVGRVEQIGRTARNCRQAPLPDAVALELRQRTEQRLGVGVLGAVEELEDGRRRGMMGGMRRAVALLSVVAWITVLAPPSASAHLSAEPAFVAAGSKERIVLTVHNDREATMTGFRLTVPEGFRIHGTGGDGSSNEAVDGAGATASWTEGSLAAFRPTTFEVDVEATGVDVDGDLVAVLDQCDQPAGGRLR